MSPCTATYYHTKILTHCQIAPRIYPNSPNVHLACKRFQILRLSVVKKSVAEMSVAAAASLVVQLHSFNMTNRWATNIDDLFQIALNVQGVRNKGFK